MADTQAQTARPDVDIASDIQEIMVHYPPLAADRPHVRVTVTDGHVTLSGHVKSPISARYLQERALEVRGVNSIQFDKLYDEETLRLDAGTKVPEGVQVNARYGVVILTGQLPEGTSEQEVVSAVASVPGVERVVTSF